MASSKRPLTALGALALLLTVGIVAIYYSVDPQAWKRTRQLLWYENQGYHPAQPFKFDHQLHAGKRKISCYYCHSGIDRGATGVVPSLDICMNCHQAIPVEGRPQLPKLLAAYKAKQPVEWVNVHDLPDFVRFNHQQHLAKGVACQTCHGPVEEMQVVEQWAPLTMGWCVNCHRDWTANKGARAPTSCQTCHY